jgi:hypothetical protein
MNMQTPNIETSSNPDVLTGGSAGAVIKGNEVPAQVTGDLTISGNLTVSGSYTGPGVTGPTGAHGATGPTGALSPVSVTGSKASGAALTNLLTVLATQNIIVDNTTA